MKGTDFIVHYLMEHEAVSHVFTYAGGTNAWLLDALHRADGIKYIPMRDEKNAALAADGYARTSGRLGVGAPMSGPGATNMVTGIADAFFDSVPVLFLTSQVTTSTYKFDKPVRQLGYQETDIVSVAKPITKSAGMATTANEMLSMLREGIALAKAERPGPVLLDIPSDIQRIDVEQQELMLGAMLDRGRDASDIEVAATLDLIRGSERPIIVAGGGIRTSWTQDLLLEFAERMQIPVVVSLMGKDSFPHDHPLFVGFIGSYGNRYANLALANCDLVIALGSRLDSRQTANPKTFARGAKKIQVSVDKNELNNTVVSDLAIHASLKSFFDKALARAEQQSSERYGGWLKYIAEAKFEFDIDGIGSERGVNPKTFLRELSEVSSGKEVFLADVGNHQMWAAQELRIRSGQRFLTSGGLGTMGFAIPAGVGAYYAAPDRPIVALVGDGGFQMSIPELQTIVHNNLPVKLIVFNNGILGLMWHFQNENFANGHPATEEGYSCPDIQKISAAYGIASQRVEDNSSAKDTVKWLLSTEGPALLEIVVDRSWAGYPKVKPGNPLERQLPEIGKERLARYMLIPTL